MEVAQRQRTIIIGAGFGGLAAALSANAAGEDVLVLERQPTPGGKARNLDVNGRSVAAGPTVLTMKWVFDRLLDRHGLQLDDLVKLKRADTLARHHWKDGSRIDLLADIEASAAAIEAFSDTENADGYRRFCNDSAAIFSTLRDTYIAAQRPGPLDLVRRIGMFDFRKQLALKPLSTLWGALGRYFTDQRLRQLFARYATYCGSSPFQAPATLMLVAHVEQEGIWIIDGGMAALAKKLEDLASAKGVEFTYGADVAAINCVNGTVSGVTLTDGTHYACSKIIYNGDTAALGELTVGAVGGHPPSLKQRSLSARTWCLEADVSGFDLAHHTVFFSDDYRKEFNQIIQQRRMPDDPTVYICAQDRDADGVATAEPAQRGERMLFIVNACADGDNRNFDESETERCLNTVLNQLEAHGLLISRPGMATQATMPDEFNRLFPGSGGALYGRASHGWTASFKRPGARTQIPGLYLAGGSVHPGPGVPMAALSGMLAAECLAADRGSTHRYQAGATFGGTSTA